MSDNSKGAADAKAAVAKFRAKVAAAVGNASSGVAEAPKKAAVSKPPSKPA